MIVRRDSGKQWAWLAALLVMAVAGGCSKRAASPQIVVEAKFASEPIHLGRDALVVILKDTSARPVTGARVTVEGNMAHPGMAPSFAEAEEKTAGSYHATIDFTMKGSWVVLVHARLPGGQAIEKQIPIEVKD